MANILVIKNPSKIPEKCNQILFDLQKFIDSDNDATILIIGNYPNFSYEKLAFLANEQDSGKSHDANKDPTIESINILCRFIASLPQLKQIIISNVYMNEECLNLIIQAISENRLIEDIKINNLILFPRSLKYENILEIGNFEQIISFSLGIYNNIIRNR